ncbi:hypothetical protein SB87_gp006 [Parapoxvirus red deer/HL953]|uniref:RhoA inhibitor n=1 Tax=Parapoxvirus red deer/HL953 TaxID=1579460 RepID=A0A0A7M9T2_9POXV|nr:hypothetical protein SB87_gp006 [Parapoxvirus red deer/HL953]AIZ77259.1 hypothetical protein [Parapoxvirus red deer/HL953]
MASLAKLFNRLRRSRSCVPRVGGGCVPRRPSARSNDSDDVSDDDIPYGADDAIDAPQAAAARPMALTVPGNSCPVLVDSVFERHIPDMDALVTHVGGWTEIGLFESRFWRAPVRMCRSVFASFVYDCDGFFEVGECQAIKLQHGEWYIRHKVAPSVAAFVAVVCIRNEGMAALSVTNTMYLNTNIKEGDVVIFPAGRGVFMMPQLGGQVEYMLVNLKPTLELLDMGFQVFPPSVNQDAQILAANAADSRKRASAIITTLITKRVCLEECYQEICRMLIMISEFNTRYGEVGSRMIAESVSAIAQGMGSGDVSAAVTTLCRMGSRRRRPVSAALTRAHSLLNNGLQSLFSVFASNADGTPHPDSLMARMDSDLRGLYDKFSELWDQILENASDLDSTIPRGEAIERFIHLQVCNSEAGVRRNALVERLTLLAGAGYQLTGSGEGIGV